VKLVWYFLDTLILFNKVIQKSDCYWVLVQVCTAPMLSKPEKILIRLNCKQKSLWQQATAELYPKEPKEAKKRITARKLKQRVWVWCLSFVCFSLSDHGDPYFLVWWSLSAQEKGLFQDSKI